MKIKWSGLGMTDGSGKIGGNVAAKNRFGHYLRRKGQVLNPQTVLQQTYRMAFGAIAQAWRDLTQAQRNGWNALTEFAQVFDQFGDQVRLTGAQLYSKFSLNLTLINEAIVDDAPVLAGAAQLLLPVAQVDIGNPAVGGQFELTIQNAVNSAAQDSVLVIEATPPVPAGRSEGSIKNLYRNISVAANAFPALTGGTVVESADFADAAPNIAVAYVGTFGMPQEGQKIFFRFSAVNAVTGERSPYISTVTTVLDTP